MLVCGAAALQASEMRKMVLVQWARVSWFD